MNKLKNNNPFKLLIYTLFFITCSVGFILGYVLLDMYEAGIFQGRSESELRAELEADYQSEMLTTCVNRGAEYIRNTLDISYSDDEWGDYEYDPDALQKKDMNHDNVVDASDFLMLLSEKKNAFDKYDRTYEEDLEKTYGYAKTDLYVSVGDDWDSSKTGESNSVMLAQTDNLPEKALVYGVLGEKAVVSTTIGIPTGKILSYDTYKEAQSIGVEKEGNNYDYVNMRMPDEAALSRSEVSDDYGIYQSDLEEAALSRSEMSDDYGIDLSDLEKNTTETEAETKNSGISEESATSEDSTTMEEEIESSGSYSTPEGVTISYNGDQITITANGKTKQYEYDAENDMYYPIIKDGYTVIVGNYAGDDITIYASGNLYIDGTSDVSSRMNKSLQAISKAASGKNRILLFFGLDFVLCIIFMITSMVLSGKDGVVRKVEKVPVEIILAGIVVLISLLIAFAQNICYSLSYAYYSYSDTDRLHYFIDSSITGHDIETIVCLIGLGCICTVGLLLINNLIARVKQSNLLNTSWIVRLGRKLFGKSGKITAFFRYVFSRVPFIIKAILLYIVITIVEIIVALLVTNAVYIDEAGFIVLMLLKIICAIAYMGFVCMMQELFMGGDQLAKGEYGHKVNTRFMFGKFKEHGENLNHINEGVQLAVDDRMKSERMKTELITNVSHDIKTPLTSIINYVDLLQKENIEKEPEASYIEVIARQSARLKKLIVDLVDASKASTGNVKVELVNMDANMIAEQASGEYIDKLMQKNITLVTNLAKDRAGIEADGRHLWRVFDNLLNNAFKYTMPGTRLYVNTYITDEDGNVIRDLTKSIKEPAKVCIEFKNISEAPLNISSDELMERFVRGDSSRNTEGSGLGLSITRSLCQLQHADFNIVIDGDLFKAVITFAYCREPEEEQTTEEEQTMNPEADIENE